MEQKPIKPEPWQESVWNYPRPPRLEPTDKRIQVIFNGVMIADTIRALRVLETSHPPIYYLPQKDILMKHLKATNRATTCEWKGDASYFSVTVGDKIAANAAWTYLTPKEPYDEMRGFVAFYPALMDICLVNGEVVQLQAGDFYGGWITTDIVGPFKGG